MAYPDKELWERVKPNPDRYEYIPIPKEVAEIIVRKKNNRVLLAHYIIDGRTKEKTLMLHYVVEEHGYLSNAPGGYCTSQFENVTQALVGIAKNIAADYPYYKTKKRRKL